MIKVIIIVVAIVLGVFIFGLISKGGFGPPPSSFLGSPVESNQPPCPQPLILKTPVDINQVSSILYPGQERGGDFKPHGGFRFDNASSNEIEIRAPMDAKFTDGSRYIEMGEVQYMFDFQSDCGIRYRFDHLLTLTPKFAEIAKKLPDPKVGDSRTTSIEPVSVKEGELIATAVGFKNSKNVFVDFGVYDLRGKGRTNPREYAICWFDLLPTTDSAKVKSLPPGNSKSGTQSTLCK